MGDVATLVAYRPSGVPIQPFTITPNGEIRIVAPPTQKFTETWDLGTIDSINKWIPTSGGGGVAPAAVVGQGQLSSGVTLNGFAKLTSIQSFRPPEPGQLLCKCDDLHRRGLDHRLMMICAHLPRSG